MKFVESGTHHSGKGWPPERRWSAALPPCPNPVYMIWMEDKAAHLWINLAHRLNTTPQNLYNKFKRDNFSEKELQEIANAMECEFRGLFIDKNTGEEIWSFFAFAQNKKNLWNALAGAALRSRGSFILKINCRALSTKWMQRTFMIRQLSCQTIVKQFIEIEIWQCYTEIVLIKFKDV